MALAIPRCGIVGVDVLMSGLNVIWGRNLRVRVSIIDYCIGRVAEMVDPHCAHNSERGRPTSSSHHLGGKHATPLGIGMRAKNLVNGSQRLHTENESQ